MPQLQTSDRSSSPSARLLLLAAAAIAMVTAGCKPKQAGGFPTGPVEVTVVTLKSSTVPLLRELPGRVSARLIAEVRPQVGGLVKRVAFVEGAQVKAGQVLYELDDAPYRVALTSAEANRLRAQAALDIARRAAERGDELVKNALISRQDHDALQATLQQARGDLAAAEANLQNARINLGWARIKAPISGRIGKSTVTQGALVVTNQEAALATIQQIDQVFVDLTQSSTEWLQLRSELGLNKASKLGNRKVKLLLENGAPYEQLGQLQFSDVTVDQSTGSFLLRVLAPNPDRLLLPGMYARAVIEEGVITAILAPQQAISRDPRGNATAWIVNANNQAEQRQVTTLRALDDQWVVSAGLNPGDRVIVEGLQKIMPGATLSAHEAVTAASSSSSSASASSR